MFNIGFTEMILLGVIALIFIGPKELPEVARTIGRLLNELKRATSDFQDTFTANITTEAKDRWDEARRQQEEEEHRRFSGAADLTHQPDDPGHESGQTYSGGHESGQSHESGRPNEADGRLPVGAAPVGKPDGEGQS